MNPRSDPLGRIALFSPPAPALAATGNGKHSLYSRRPGTGRPSSAGSTRIPPTGRQGGPAPTFGAFVVDCSGCHARSRVTPFELAARHLPFWLWVPWQRYSNLMSCPACEERTWLGVTWSP